MIKLLTSGDFSSLTTNFYFTLIRKCTNIYLLFLLHPPFFSISLTLLHSIYKSLCLIFLSLYIYISISNTLLFLSISLSHSTSHLQVCTTQAYLRKQFRKQDPGRRDKHGQVLQYCYT